MTSNSLTASWCPYCLQKKPSATSATPSPENVWEGDLDAEIKRIENLISSLPLERSRLCRKRNKMRSPIYSLPPEILALIFKFACPSLNFSRKYGLDSLVPAKVTRPWIIRSLSAVSAQWHNVVLSMPSLWTSFIADDREIKAMRTIFARSGNFPVATSLDFPLSPESRESHEAILAPVLQEYASRVRMLHVHGASAIWLKKHIPCLVNLDLLSLQSGSNKNDLVLFDSSCTRLVLKDFQSRIFLAWSKIEVLQLGRIPIDVCLELLEKCSHLVEYRAKGAIDCRVEGVQLPSSLFILPRLKTFEWIMDDRSPVDRALLQYIRMPALQTLVWVDQEVDYTPALLSAFFEHLPLTLSAVKIQAGHIYSNTSIFPYILNFSNIESLTFKDCGGDFMDDVFGYLGSEMCLVGSQEVSVLPNLKSIYMDDVVDDFDHQAKLLKIFKRYCSRPSKAPQGVPLRVEFETNEVDWTPEFKEELRRVVEKGPSKVELWEDSKPVDWLPR